MENILKKSSGRAERFVLAYAIVVVMVFGVLNPLTYVTDFNTAQEISGMGKVVIWIQKHYHMEMCVQVN